MTVLSVNVNKIALLRNSRGHDFPNLLKVSQDLVAAGAQGITIHPRPDERHAKYADAQALKDNLDVELNIEGYPCERFLDMVCEVKPAQCTLVPDEPNQITSDHGWDCVKHKDFLKETVARLKAEGIRVSIFLDPDPSQVAAAKETGTDRIELYTESYAKNYGTEKQEEVSQQFIDTAIAAHEAALELNAGHDLNQENLAHFAKVVPNLLEVSIGHALVVEMLYDGLEKTVQGYRNCLK